MHHVKVRLDIIFAIMLRDMRTRYGGSHLGYVISIGQPLIHLTVLVVFIGIFRSAAPMLGTNNAVFVATGIVPYVLCLYPSRMMTQTILLYRPLFIFPIVQALDVIIARAIIEILSAFIVLGIFTICMSIAGIDLLPIDYIKLTTAILAIIYFAMSIGLFTAVMVALYPFWFMLFIAYMIIAYITAGVFILPSMIPQPYRDLMWYNPLFQCVEWLRSAYYEGYGDDMLSKPYLLWYSTTCLLLGLLGERFLRGRLKSAG